MAGFVLKNTLSDNGGVTRGICKMDEDNNLTEVVETKNIVKTIRKNVRVRSQCGQPSVNLRQVPGQSNGQWCEIGKRIHTLWSDLIKLL